MNSLLSIQVNSSRRWSKSWKSIMNTLLGTEEEKIMHQKIQVLLIVGRFYNIFNDSLEVEGLPTLWLICLLSLHTLTPKYFSLLEYITYHWASTSSLSFWLKLFLCKYNKIQRARGMNKLWIYRNIIVALQKVNEQRQS